MEILCWCLIYDFFFMVFIFFFKFWLMNTLNKKTNDKSYWNSSYFLELITVRFDFLNNVITNLNLSWGKYLVVNLDSKNCMHNLVKLKSNTTKYGYHAMNKMLNYNEIFNLVLFKETNKKLYFEYLHKSSKVTMWSFNLYLEKKKKNLTEIK